MYSPSPYRPLDGPAHWAASMVVVTPQGIYGWMDVIERNVIYSGRSGHVRAMSMKIAMVLMCNAHNEDKYQCLYYFFSENIISDGQTRIMNGIKNAI